MNYRLNWLIIYAYRNGLIGRKEFVSLWEAVQVLSNERICGENGTSNIR